MTTDTNNPDNLSPVKRALFELREMRAKLDELERAKTEPIAIIGMALRFPGGAKDPESFWQLLRNGVDAIVPTPAERRKVEEIADSDSVSFGQGGFLAEGVDRFDPHFFSIAPREATYMDPQQRMLLETSWEALEHAGQAPDQLNGSQTGIFIGISSSDYFRMVFPNPDSVDLYPITGNSYSVAAGRLSYTLGLQGPNVAIDTACSASLVAVHLACQSLRSGESTMALAGGVNLILAPEVTLSFSNSQMMAADDHCKTFDAAADGYVRGEGCGVVVLKRLSDAVANDDNILAVIRGSAINQDGRSSGLTAPNGPAQEAVIRKALANAQVAPHEVSYVETHGTGTPLGDPIEVQALAAVLSEGRSPDNKLLIGSVKTNIGHLEAAAGAASLIKTVLTLQHGEIPPHLNFREPNPYIPWEKIPVTVATQLTPWPAKADRKVAGVSSFGFSGTNAHLILEEAPTPAAPQGDKERSFHLLTFSAKRETALTELAGRFKAYLAGEGAAFGDICFTANTGRAHLNQRLALVASSAAQAAEKLTAFQAGQEEEGLFRGEVYQLTPPEVVFLFTGHGAQYIQMGRQLYETQPTFRAALQECETLLQAYLDRPLLSLLYPGPDEPDLMNKMTYAQPALFAIEYALATLWRSWGIEPAVVMGHSVGEYVAACIAGVFSLADGLKLVATRGRLMDALPETGEMVAVFANEARVAALVEPYANQAAVAVVNGPESVVISGTTAAIGAILEGLTAEGIKSRRLAVAQAAHSPLLDPILDEFESVAAEVSYSPPRLSLISCTTGKLVSSTEVTNAAYWRRHLRQPVQFFQAMETLSQQGYKLFVEIGPHPTLLGMGRRCLPEVEQQMTWLPSLRQGWDDWQQLLESLGTLYVRGVEVDWAGLDRDYPRQRVPLPTYPWLGERYWVELTPEKRPASAPAVSSRWKMVLQAGQKQAQQAPLDLVVQAYPDKWQALEQMTTAYTIHALRALGAFIKPGETYTLESLLAQTGILPTYRPLLLRWLHRLAEKALLQQEGDRFSAVQPLPDVSLEKNWQEVGPQLADIPALQAYVKRCGLKLEAVLTGQESPLETLFPEGSFETANFLYHDWSLVRYFNSIIQTLVDNVTKTRPAGRPLRILEIGAGTGGTAAALLPLLDPDQTFYHYTDVSEFFFSRAAEKFQAYPFVRYGLLDAEQDPQAQGYTLHSYDLVLAANALHATRNLTEALAHARSLLAPGGVLILFEVTEHLDWFDITTGLIEGWGRFEDGLREDNPLLSESQWQTALLAAGFEQVIAFPEEGSPAKALGQHLVVAQVPLTGVDQATSTWLHSPESQPLESQEGQPAAADSAEARRAAFMQQLQEALPDDRKDLLIDYTRTHLARILRLSVASSLNRRERLLDLGLDSLMAVELRNRLKTGLDLEQPLPATLVFDYPTIEAIAEYLNKVLFSSTVVSFATETETLTQEEATTPAVDVAELSDEEVEALLLKKLENM